MPLVCIDYLTVEYVYIYSVGPHVMMIFTNSVTLR